MLCQSCQKRIANVHFTQVVNGDKVEMYLCETCANEKGHTSFGAQMGISDFFSGLVGFGGPVQYVSAPPELQCEKCGMTYDDFLKTGKMGCEGCYSTFGEKLQPVFKRLHGAQEHSGKMPGKVSAHKKHSRELEMLREQLNKAVQQEEYEKAAELRDRIRKLEVE